jgi:hypothetical protein
MLNLLNCFSTIGIECEAKLLRNAFQSGNEQETGDKEWKE